MPSYPGSVRYAAFRFMELARKPLAEMGVAHAWHKLKTMEAHGHRLKASVRTAGAQRFGDLCAALDRPLNQALAHALQQQLSPLERIVV